MSQNKSVLVGFIIVVVIAFLVISPIITTTAKKVDADGVAIGNRSMKIITDYDYGKSVSAEKLASVSQADIDTWCGLYEAQGQMIDKCN